MADSGKSNRKNADDAAPSKAELVVLKHLWAAGRQSGREVQDAVSGDTGWSYSTTRVLLARMTEKGLVAKREFHGLAVYEAAVSKVSLMGRLIRDFAGRVLEMDGPIPSTAFARSRLFTEEEAAELEALLAEEEAE